MTQDDKNTTKVAVRCNNCQKILAFKIGATSGFLQLKCPVCRTEIKIDLSMRRVRINNRTTTHPIAIAFM